MPPLSYSGSENVIKFLMHHCLDIYLFLFWITLNFISRISMCKYYVFICVHMCLEANMHVIMCMWRPEDNLRWFPFSTIHFISYTGFLISLELTKCITLADQSSKHPHCSSHYARLCFANVDSGDVTQVCKLTLEKHYQMISLCRPAWDRLKMYY